MQPLKATDVLKQFKMLIALIIVTFAIGIFGFLANGFSFTGAFYATLESLSGKTSAEYPHYLVILLSLFGAIIIWFAIWSSFGLVVEGKFGEFLKEAKMISEIKKLKGHYIICGAGRVGQNVGIRLANLGHKVVFIEKNKDIIAKLRAKGFLVYEVGPIDEHVLKEANIQHAAGIAIALGEDGKNLLLTLTARELNRHAKIAVRATDVKMVPKLKKAGADFILLPEAFGGVKLADALAGDVDRTVIFVNDYKYLI
ncbi:MAG: NAD(P)-binding protein [Candidatus Nanoarchaeia archaeon]